MIVKNPQFEISAVSLNQCPNSELPHVVLVGKSNVGKSSFINTMTNRKNLARTSSEPGKTRQINFYNVDNTFYFVDLPGYGYSKMSKEEQHRVGEFIEQYLQSTKQISLILFLIDIRHDPTEFDKMMYNYIVNEKGFSANCIILANKADKIAPTKVDARVLELQNILNPLKDIPFLPFSAEKKDYCDDVWKEIEKRI